MKEKFKYDDRDVALLEILDDPVLYDEFCRELEAERTEEEDYRIKAAYIDSLLKPRKIRLSKSGTVLSPTKNALELVRAATNKEIKSVSDNSQVSGSGVYIICRDSEIIYVGQSRDLGKRLDAHHWGFGAEILYIDCEDTVERLDLETKLIKKLKPILNVRHCS
jgi:hypothetical protein